MFFKRDKSITMSLPEERTVCGVKLRKVPVGEYIKALKKLEALPAVIAGKCFPGQSLESVMALLASAEKDTVMALISRLMLILPEQVIETLCDIIGMDGKEAINKYTPKELMDIALAFWELNELSDFFGHVWGLAKTMLLTQNIGSSAGSPSPKA
jgi:hypothetical protein